MSSLIYEPEITHNTGKSTMNYYIFTSNQTAHHLSPSKFLPWSVKEYLIFYVKKSALIKLPLTTITHLKAAVSTKISNSHHDLRKEENAAETFYGFIRRLASKVKTNIDKIFLWFLDKHFPKHHKYYKQFNRNSFKS